MKNNLFFKLFIFILIIFVFSTSAHAFYKKKVLVGKIQNPDNWDKSYNPGNIIKEFLRNELMRQKRVQMISIPETSQKMMEESTSSFSNNYVEPAIFDSRKNDFPDIEFAQGSDLPMTMPQKEMPMTDINEDLLWLSKLGNKSLKSNYTEIKGKIIQFTHDNYVSSAEELGSAKSRNWENAVIQIHIELVQNRTGKKLYEKMFKIISRSGTELFTTEGLSLTNINNTASSLSIALNSLKKLLEKFIHDKLDSIPLEGEIIATNQKDNSIDQEEMLVNIGLSNGVSVGDMFKVDKVSMKLNDLYTTRELGDVYVKIGVIQMQEVWEDTAKAVSLAGKNFETGFLVRSIP